MCLHRDSVSTVTEVLMTLVDDTNSYKRPNRRTTMSHFVEEDVETQRVWNF